MVLVRQSTIVDAPVDTVWQILRDFNGHARWHPAVASSTIEGGLPVDAVGAVRRFQLTDGSAVCEQLLSLADDTHTLTYCILEAPFPLMGYVATIQLKPVTDGDRTFWEWRSQFEPPPQRRDELVALVQDGIYQAGFTAICALLRTPAAAMRRPAQLPAQSYPARGGTVTCRAIIIERYGGPDELRLRDIIVPPPGRDEVQVRHAAIGVNFIDVYCRAGDFDLLIPPGVPGIEAAGPIEALGDGVEGFHVGERIAYACPPVGAYCERRNMAPALLVRLPNDIADETAAAVLLKGVSASFLLHDVHAVAAGEVVLIHAAAGGVGQLLVQWARHLGATVIATVSNEDKARVVERLGAHHAVVYTREDFAAAVRRITAGRGVDVAYDAVGADTFAGSLAALAPRGHLVSYGQASGAVGAVDIGGLAAKSVTISRPNYGHYTDTAERLAPHVARLFAALRQGTVVAAPPRRYSLAEAAQAHRDLEARRTMGSLVLMP